MMNENILQNDNVETKEKIDKYPNFSLSYNFWLNRYLQYKVDTLGSIPSVKARKVKSCIAKSGIKSKKEELLPILKEYPALKTYFYPLWYFYQYIIEYKPKSLLQIGSKALEVYISEHMDIFSPSTKKNHLIVLLEFFKYIKEHGYTDIDREYFNFSYKKLSKFIEGKKEVIEAITNGELERFIEYVRTYKKKKALKEGKFTESRNKLMVLMLLFGGFRSEELINIKTSDIEEHNELYRIKVRGKGNKERIVYIPVNLIYEEMESYLEKKSLLFCKTEYLFVTKNCKKMHYQGVYKVVKRMIEKSGIKTKKFGGHILRHSYAVYLLKQGFSINEVKKLLGHTSIVTTQKYLEVSDSDIENKFKKGDKK